SDTYDIENEDDNQANEVTDYETATYEEIYNIIAGEEYSEEEAVEEEISTFSLRSAEPLTTVEENTMRFVDLALIVDTTGSMGSQIRTIQKELAELIYMLREDNISLYVSIIDYRDITCDGVDSTKVNNNSGVAFYNSVDNITTAIESLRASGGGDTPETAIDGLGAAYNLNFRNSAAKYAFLITDANYKNNNNYGIADMEEMAELLESKNISTSVITSSYYYNYYNGLTALTGGELISMYDDFCEDMYRIISSETPIANVVIANNIVSGYFDEELVKGGDCDTDGDTLTDSDEVDWEYVEKVYDNGEYELYTWKELCEKSHFWFINWADYVDGTSNPLFDSMSNIKVIPATSNPFSADTDNDYYPDNEDSDKLEANAMYIYDSGIDDDDFHNGNPIVEKTSDKYTDGKLIIDNNAGTAKYSFTRRPKEEANFILTPNGRSFYKFDYNNNYCNIEVSYTKWYKNWGEPIYVERQDDGTYLLEQGTEYIISIIGGGNSEFNFTVEQDNWVYAPNGCIQTVETYANTLNPYLATSRYFVSEGMLYATIADIVGTEQDLSDIDNIEKIMDNLGYDREQYIITGEDVGNVVMADAILVVSVYSLGGTIATEGVSAVIATKYSIAGAAGTIGSVVYDVIFTPNINLFNKFMGYLEKLDLEDTFENCQNITGEYNIYCSNCIGIGLQNMWDVWETAPYIRKLDGAANTYSTELIDFTYTEKLRNSFGWK
ncbi:vWA domain-containing protein, partial [[Eubacterium] siraeum]